MTTIDIDQADASAIETRATALADPSPGGDSSFKTSRARRLCIGTPADPRSSFRSLALFLARDPLYSRVPLGRLQILDQALTSGRCWVATVDQEVIGLCIWRTVPREVALEAVRVRAFARKFPDAESPDAVVFITAVTASRPGVVFRMLRRFKTWKRGQAIFYERHGQNPDGSARTRLDWVDRQGRPRGPDL